MRRFRHGFGPKLRLSAAKASAIAENRATPRRLSRADRENRMTISTLARNVALSAWRRAFFVALIALGAVAAAPQSAFADVRCETAAYTFRGSELQGTRTASVRVSERRACSAALSSCEARLERLRYETGRRLPRARCDVLGISYFRRPTHRPRYRDDYSRPWPRYERPGADWRRAGPRCNYRACEQHYRSFRASDCSFQPYHGPRKRCAL